MIPLCLECGLPIKSPPHDNRHPRKFCSRLCCAAWRRRTGFYRWFSQMGNRAQAEEKRRTGYIPKYEKRAQSVRLSNKEHPRRRRRVP